MFIGGFGGSCTGYVEEGSFVKGSMLSYVCVKGLCGVSRGHNVYTDGHLFWR